METKGTPAVATRVHDSAGIIEAYPSIFGVRDHVGDIVHPGAFRKTLNDRAGRPFKVFWSHNIQGLPIGKTLDVREVGKADLDPAILARWPEATGGLHAAIQLADTAQAKDILALVRDGVLDELSFGYDAVKSDFSTEGRQVKTRNLHEVRLHEISVVAFPANPAARITAVKAALTVAGGDVDLTDQEVAALLGLPLSPADEVKALTALITRLRGRFDALAQASDAEASEPQAGTVMSPAAMQRRLRTLRVSLPEA